MKNNVTANSKNIGFFGIPNRSMLDFSSETMAEKIAKQSLLQILENHELEVEELRTRNKKLLAIIGHDIKTPIRSIIGFLSYIKDNFYEMKSDKIEEFIDMHAEIYGC